MNSIQRICLSLLLLLTATFLISSPCYSQTEITLWHSLPKEYSDIFQNMVSQHTAKLHGMTVVKIRRFETSDELHQTLLKGTELPDVALIDTRWQKALANKYNPIFLEDIIKSRIGSSVFISFKTDTVSAMWESSKHNEKLMTIPFYGYNRALIINNTVLSQLEIKDPPAKWSDMMNMGKKLSEKNGGNTPRYWLFMIPVKGSPEEMAEFFQVFLWQMGRDISSAFLDGEVADFDGSEGQAILRMMSSMLNQYQICPPDGTASKDNVAMFIGTPKDYLDMVTAGRDIKVKPLPFDNKSANDLVVYAFMVFNNNNEGEHEKIWHLLYELCEFKQGLVWSLQTPYLPPNKQIPLSPDYFAHMKANPGLQIFLQQLKNSRVATLDESRIKILNNLGTNIQLVLAKRSTAEDSLRSSSTFANKILDPSGKLAQKKTEFNDINGYIKKVWAEDYQ